MKICNSNIDVTNFRTGPEGGFRGWGQIDASWVSPWYENENEHLSFWQTFCLCSLRRSNVTWVGGLSEWIEWVD